MERAWPIWRVLRSKGGPSLAELLTSGVWDLYRLYEYNALLDMDDDTSAAIDDRMHIEHEQRNNGT